MPFEVRTGSTGRESRRRGVERPRAQAPDTNLNSFSGLLQRGTAGHTLVEVVVTTALVVTVLVPLSSLAVYLLTVKQNKPHIEALAIGQRVMEETLHVQSYVSQTMELEGGRWRVRKTVSQTGNRVTIAVRVFRRNQPQPLVELMTVRLWS